jgi:hypothetical protein
MIAGDIAGVRWLDARRQRRLVGPAAAASFLPYLVFAARPPIPVALALLFLSGACGFYSLGLDGRVRDAVPDHLFARAMALNTAGLMTLQGIGFAAAGAVAEATGPAAAITLAGVGGLASVVALLRRDLVAVFTAGGSGSAGRRPESAPSRGPSAAHSPAPHPSGSAGASGGGSS